MLETLRKAMRQEKGFTLIELLVVIAIIGILAAIAIPQFAAYKRQANDGAAKSQLRNMAVSLEAYYVANNDYGGAGATVGQAALDPTYGYATDANVTIVQPSAVLACGVAPGTGVAGTSCFSMDATHASGTPGLVFTWTSDQGGAQW